MRTPCEICGGSCCKSIFLPKSLWKADVANWVSLHGESEESRIRLDTPCSALKDGRCSIYETRPDVCRVAKVGDEQCLKAVRLFNPEKMNEVKAAIMDTKREDWQDFLVKHGGEVKATPEGQVSGYLVLFSDETLPDLAGDFFTKDTDFGEHKTSPTLYHHGMDVKLGSKVIGEATLVQDDVGVWIEAQLYVRDLYEKAVLKLAQLGKLGWSSGTAPHLVKREKKGGANKILAWPLGLDASLTPSPCDTRNVAISMKSVEASDIETLTEPEAVGDTAAQSQIQSAVEGDTKMEEKQEVKAEPTELERIVQKAVEAQKQEVEAQAEKDAREAKLVESIKSIVSHEVKNAPAIKAGGPALNLKTGLGDNET
jgi:hypothetical protein